MEQPIGQDDEDPASDPGQPEEGIEENLVAMQMQMAATMLGLNPDDGFNECNVNQQSRRMELLLHPDAAARNEVPLTEATAMFQCLGNARDFIL